ncbi:MAG: membrane protein insertion efficiency factor YidD [Marinilabiliaceae bacterium]|nr:membrane protein insertion efficiency factor YidD [Marinilabiliaceae bacterium]
MSDFYFYRNNQTPIISLYNHPKINLQKEKRILNSATKIPIIIYQRFISDQFQPNCIFHPSCSQFGIESLHAKGLIKGLLLTGDRMMRCSSMNYPHYFRHHVNGKICDHVKIY